MSVLCNGPEHSILSPAAAVGVQKEVPELLPPEHVHEEVGGRVDAAREVGQADDDVEERRAVAHGIPRLMEVSIDVDSFVQTSVLK